MLTCGTLLFACFRLNKSWNTSCKHVAICPSNDERSKPRTLSGLPPVLYSKEVKANHSHLPWWLALRSCSKVFKHDCHSMLLQIEDCILSRSDYFIEYIWLSMASEQTIVHVYLICVTISILIFTAYERMSDPTKKGIKISSIKIHAVVSSNNILRNILSHKLCVYFRGDKYCSCDLYIFRATNNHLLYFANTQRLVVTKTGNFIQESRKNSDRISNLVL